MSGRTSLGDIAPYITRDGSEIRELVHPDVHALRNQSLAEAVVAPGAATLLHRHETSEEIYHVTRGSGRMTLGLETFAFNSSPVPDHFFDTYTITLPAEELEDLIFVIADVHDPVSNIGEAGDLYFGSHHVTALIQFNFELKEMLSSRKVDLLDLRFDRHSITRLANNATALLTIYRNGW